MKQLNLLIMCLLWSFAAFAQYSGTGPITLSGIPAGATGIQWYKNGSVISGEINTTYTATTQGYYYATYTDASTTCTDDRTVTFLLVNNGQSATLTGATNNGGGSAYQWYRYDEGTAVAGATSANYTATTGGLYVLIYNNGTCEIETQLYYVFMLTAPITASNPSLQTATVGQSKSGNAATELAPTGGTTPYTYSNGSSDPVCTAPSGATALPASSNLTVTSNTGAYTYTAPSTAGTYYFCIKICDSATPTASCVVKTYTLTVSAPACTVSGITPTIIKN
jgi:hypothetical protein